MCQIRNPGCLLIADPPAQRLIMNSQDGPGFGGEMNLFFTVHPVNLKILRKL